MIIGGPRETCFWLYVIGVGVATLPRPVFPPAPIGEDQLAPTNLAIVGAN
jgi:hypothetical protein